jgi:hypothetical protein
MIRFIFVILAGFLSLAPVRANEQTDKRLAELLRPDVSVAMLPGQPKMFAEPRPILPGIVLVKFQGQPLRPSFAAAKRVLPHDPAEPAPLVAYVAKVEVPREIVLQTGPLVALPSADSNVRAPVPILARPATDRAPLTDATLESSMAAVLRAAIPLRLLTVPFVPQNLPDPFELQNSIRMPNPLEEDFQPMAVPPRVLLKTTEPVKK